MNFDMSNQNNNGLLRFRSAPSSVLQSFINEIEKPRDLNDGLSYNLLSQSLQDLEKEESNGYSLSSQLPPHYPRQGTSPGRVDSTSSYSVGSSLLRQNSSPAGLFTHLNQPNGYGGVGCYSRAAANGGGNGGDPSRLKRQVSLSPGVKSLGVLPRISEVEPSVVNVNDSGDFPFGPWEQDSSSFIQNLTELKRELIDDDDDDNEKLFGGGPQINAESMGNHPPMLSHHLSLPNNCGEMAAVDKLLHFQDTVPCKIRAKRGCATHPRSIAERVRRTRISERMRKLQDLVPHMDKQTSTADMLDFAVDYIKELQGQFKTLSECRENCICSAKSGQN